jgi:hypothetical protein
MDRRSRRASARAMLCAVVVAAALPASADAQSTTDLVDWNLTESVATWGGGTQFHISAGGDGWAAFRWLDSPNKTTVISANGCTDYSLLGSQTYPVNDTGYRNLFWGPGGACFVMRGRTAAGSGSMVNHDGRVKR